MIQRVQRWDSKGREHYTGQSPQTSSVSWALLGPRAGCRADPRRQEAGGTSILGTWWVVGPLTDVRI